MKLIVDYFNKRISLSIVRNDICTFPNCQHLTTTFALILRVCNAFSQHTAFFHLLFIYCVTRQIPTHMELHPIATCSSLAALGYSARGQVEERKREMESGRDDGRSTKGRRGQERHEQGRMGNLPLEGKEIGG